MNEWSAQSVWICDPLFLQPGERRNVHSYFRREFESAAVQGTRLLITAADCYRLWINGEYVGDGPAPSYHFAYAYDEYDVSRFVRAGRNVVAVEVYYQGLINRVWNSGSGVEGMRLELSAGGRIALASDPQWKVHTSTAYSGERKLGYDTQFLEDIDGRKLPHGWQRMGHDDSAWQVAGAPESSRMPTLFDHGVKPIQMERVAPASVKSLRGGDYLLDFGEEIVGCVEFAVAGLAGHRVEIRHAEELTEDGRARYKMRCTAEYLDTYTLAGVPGERVQLFDYKGFRFVELLCMPSEVTADNVWAMRRSYAFDAKRSEFTSADPVLQGIWRICVNGVRDGCQGVMVDCPTREKGQYLGDAVVTSLSHLYAQGDPALSRKMIREFALSRRVREGLTAVAPGSFVQEIADFSLLYGDLVSNYYEQSGDEALVAEVAPAVRHVLEYFEPFRNADGLLEDVSTKWNIVDWPDNLRDGYDYDRAVKGVNTVLNAYYQGALQTAGTLLKDDRYAAQATSHAEAFRRVLRDPGTGLFVDAAGSSHSSFHANVLPLVWGITPEADVPQAIELLREKGLCCGVFFAAFALRALLARNQQDLAYELMLRPGANSWRTMLDSGVTACIEAWHPDQKWNTSLCHPWSSSPIWVFAGHFMGLKPGTPGWKTLRFAPQTPAAMPAGRLRITTVAGEFSVEYRPGRERSYRVKTPVAMTVPKGARVDGKASAMVIPAGEHEVVIG